MRPRARIGESGAKIQSGAKIRGEEVAARIGRSRRRSQPRSPGEIDLEPVAFALMSPGHFGAGVAEVFLHMHFLDLRRGGEPGAQGMAAEGEATLAFRQIAAHPCRHRASLDETGDVPVGEPLRGDAAVFAGDWPEQGPVADATQAHPGFEQRDGAGLRPRAAADLDLAPAGLAEDFMPRSAEARARCGGWRGSE